MDLLGIPSSDSRPQGRSWSDPGRRCIKSSQEEGRATVEGMWHSADDTIIQNSAATQVHCPPPVPPPSAIPQCHPQCHPPVPSPSALPQCPPPVPSPSAIPQCPPPVPSPSAIPQCHPPVLHLAQAHGTKGAYSLFFRPYICPPPPVPSPSAPPPCHPQGPSPSAILQCHPPVPSPGPPPVPSPSAIPQCHPPVLHLAQAHGTKGAYSPFLSALYCFYT
ncbi:SH3 domain-containing protein C23A1.17-like [Penaeus monodon]|uniref:SH3 domain-containing protein C23A1.17-like n=1 Tax=Penaeus monodon TaxID=6687 RepID=UPI0018A7DEE8|nr:SH3 domain-containing protein C23A1.17-like [Penaeus monodon]